MDQEFYNPNDRLLEGTYLFPVPAGAQLDHFSMDVNGQSLSAELLDADQARRVYEEVVRKQRDPALLEYVGRDVFRVRIFPIEPRSSKRVRVAYTQLLRADAGLVSYRYPLNAERSSAGPLQKVSVSVMVGLETRSPLKTIYSPTHAVAVRRQGERRATVGFEARQDRPDGDFQLIFGAEDGAVGLSMMTWVTGDEDPYFLLMAAPAWEAAAARVVPKDVVLVLDTSGSMAGRKLEQARRAFAFCVANLNDGDRFEVIRFSTDVELLFGQLVEASRANRDRATAFIELLKPIGGTAIHDALQRALGLHSGGRMTANGPMSEPGRGSDRSFLVVFLTDGLPTVGETDNDRILTAVKDVSQGGARVFCFGIGTDVNTHLLDGITEVTHGASAYVLPEEDLGVKVSAFFTKVRDPVLTDLRIAFPGCIRVTQLHPGSLPDLFRGEQLLLVGRYRGTGAGRVELSGWVDGKPQRFGVEARFGERTVGGDFIPRLWATRRVGELLDEIRLHGDIAELREEITELARKYGIVTPYTAYLIHEDEVRREVPVGLQSVSIFATNRVAREAGALAYRALAHEASGGAAVAAARSTMQQRSADQVGLALGEDRLEAFRGQLASSATLRAGPGTADAGAVGAGGREVALPVGVGVLGPQSQFAGGRTFFLNGDCWVDSRVPVIEEGEIVVVQFNSAAYFELVRNRPEVRPWLAVGRNVKFMLGSTCYGVRE